MYANKSIEIEIETGILLCSAEIPEKRAFFSHMTAPARLAGLKKTNSS